MFERNWTSLSGQTCLCVLFVFNIEWDWNKECEGKKILYLERTFNVSPPKLCFTFSVRGSYVHVPSNGIRIYCTCMLHRLNHMKLFIVNKLWVDIWTKVESGENSFDVYMQDRHSWIWYVVDNSFPRTGDASLAYIVSLVLSTSLSSGLWTR